MYISKPHSQVIKICILWKLYYVYSNQILSSNKEQHDMSLTDKTDSWFLFCMYNCTIKRMIKSYYDYLKHLIIAITV